MDRVKLLFWDGTGVCLVTKRLRLEPSATVPAAEFLHSIGRIKNKPESWKDYFFSFSHGLKGS